MGEERGVSVYEWQETIREMRGERQTNTASTAAAPARYCRPPRWYSRFVRAADAAPENEEQREEDHDEGEEDVFQTKGGGGRRLLRRRRRAPAHRAVSRLPLRICS